MPQSEIRVQITRSQGVTLRSIGDELPAPVVAMNWFDTRRSALYQLYNLLALPLVRAVGGRPLFKGRVGEVLWGSEELRREWLLLVHYPACTSFRDLLLKRRFQAISPLRMASARRFTFALTRPNPPGERGNHTCFAVLQVSHPDPAAYLEALTKAAEKLGASALWSLETAALVHPWKSGEPGAPLRSLFDATLLLSAAEASVLAGLPDGTEFHALLGEASAGVLATVERTYRGD